MTARTTARSSIKNHAKWLCALALVGCDDPDVALVEDEDAALAVEDEAQDALIVADAELREVCELAGLESQPPVDEFTDAADPALGTCSTGNNNYVPTDHGCGSCTHPNGERGKKVEHWWQYCYTAPSPPACGCEPKTLWYWSCELGC